jgi:hypothetical protein
VAVRLELVLWRLDLVSLVIWLARFVMRVISGLSDDVS